MINKSEADQNSLDRLVVETNGPASEAPREML